MISKNRGHHPRPVLPAEPRVSRRCFSRSLLASPEACSSNETAFSPRRSHRLPLARLRRRPRPVRSASSSPSTQRACHGSLRKRRAARRGAASRGLDMRLRMGYAEDSRVCRFGGLGTAPWGKPWGGKVGPLLVDHLSPVVVKERSQAGRGFLSGLRISRTDGRHPNCLLQGGIIQGRVPVRDVNETDFQGHSASDPS